MEIKTLKENEAALIIVDLLMDAEAGSPDEVALSVLAGAIDKFETGYYFPNGLEQA